MKYTNQLTAKKSLSALIPVFSFEQIEEEPYVKRMNAFYSELLSSLITYTESEFFPRGARYFARVLVSFENDTARLHTVLQLRKGGKTLKRLDITHIWRMGIIIEKA